MKVLLSIKPKFALKIFDGSKKFEFRRIIFKRPGIEKVLVYASSPVKRLIGEFEIDTILSDDPLSLWNKTRNHAGIDEKHFFDYFSNANKGYAIKIKNYRIYSRPLIIEDCFGVSPPQSFIYLE